MFCPALSVHLHPLLPFEPWHFLLLSYPSQNEGFNGLVCFYLHILLSWPPQATSCKKAAPFGSMSKGWESLYSTAACIFLASSQSSCSKEHTVTLCSDRVAIVMLCPFLGQCAALVKRCHLPNEPPWQCCTQRDPCLGDRQHWRAAAPSPINSSQSPFWAGLSPVPGWNLNCRGAASPLMQGWNSFFQWLGSLSQLKQLPLKILLWTPLCFIFSGFQSMSKHPLNEQN